MNEFNWKRGLIGGLVLSLVIVVMFIPIVIESRNGPDVIVDYDCKETPGDIPDTLFNGTRVYWDCDWQSSYVNGQVTVVWVDKYDHSKGAQMIARESY